MSKYINIVVYIGIVVFGSEIGAIDALKSASTHQQVATASPHQQAADQNIFASTLNLEEYDPLTFPIAAAQLANRSGDCPIKIFAFQEVYELKWWNLAGAASAAIGNTGSKINSELTAALNSETSESDENKYVRMASTHRGAMHLVVFVRKNFQNAQNVSAISLPTYSLDWTGSKGAVAVHIAINKQKKFLTVINAHLTARDGHQYDGERKIMFRNIMEKYSSGPTDYVGDDNVVIFLGDLNSRLSIADQETNKDPTVAMNSDDLKEFKNSEQYKKYSLEVHRVVNSLNKAEFDPQNLNFDLSDHYFPNQDPLRDMLFQEGFVENEKRFLPTYRIEQGDGTPRSDEQRIVYHEFEREKRCTPAWADRVFVKGHLHDGNEFGGVAFDILEYNSMREVTASDHLPVFGVFKITTQEERQANWAALEEQPDQQLEMTFKWAQAASKLAESKLKFMKFQNDQKGKVDSDVVVEQQEGTKHSESLNFGIEIENIRSHYKYAWNELDQSTKDQLTQQWDQAAKALPLTTADAFIMKMKRMSSCETMKERRQKLFDDHVACLNKLESHYEARACAAAKKAKADEAKMKAAALAERIKWFNSVKELTEKYITTLQEQYLKPTQKYLEKCENYSKLLGKSHPSFQAMRDLVSELKNLKEDQQKFEQHLFWRMNTLEY